MEKTSKSHSEVQKEIVNSANISSTFSKPSKCIKGYFFFLIQIGDILCPFAKVGVLDLSHSGACHTNHTAFCILFE